jgi:hypothetical protein
MFSAYHLNLNLSSGAPSGLRTSTFNFNLCTCAL